MLKYWWSKRYRQYQSLLWVLLRCLPRSLRKIHNGRLTIPYFTKFQPLQKKTQDKSRPPYLFFPPVLDANWKKFSKGNGMIIFRLGRNHKIHWFALSNRLYFRTKTRQILDVSFQKYQKNLVSSPCLSKSPILIR